MASRFGGSPATLGYATGQTMDLAQARAYELSGNTNLATIRPMGAIDPIARVIASDAKNVGLL